MVEKSRDYMMRFDSVYNQTLIFPYYNLTRVLPLPKEGSGPSGGAPVMPRLTLLLPVNHPTVSVRSGLIFPGSTGFMNLNVSSLTIFFQ